MANGNGETPLAAGNGETVSTAPAQTTWMSDVQRAIAIILIGTFAVVTFLATVCAVFWPEATALIDMAKTLQAALVNMGLIALGFFFGSNMSKMLAEAGQQKIMEKLTSSAPPATGPVAPVTAAPAVVVKAWWSLLEDPERAAINEAAKTDQRARLFMSTAEVGRATVEDLDYVVKAGLLTRERADAIQAA